MPPPPGSNRGEQHLNFRSGITRSTVVLASIAGFGVNVRTEFIRGHVVGGVERTPHFLIVASEQSSRCREDSAARCPVPRSPCPVPRAPSPVRSLPTSFQV